MIDQPQKKILIGASLVGKALDYNNPSRFTAIADILSGKVDVELACLAFNSQIGRIPKTDADLKAPAALEQVSTIKKALRKEMQALADLVAEEYRKQTMEKFKKTNRPSEFGTINDISVRYKISKSEVRRLKQEGKLEEFIVLEKLKGETPPF